LTTWQAVLGQELWSVTAVTFAGQVIVGGCVSLTVTVNVHMDPVELVQVTLVVPFGKNEPAAGEHITMPQAPPLSVGGG
jgi:hypothetical protein